MAKPSTEQVVDNLADPARVAESAKKEKTRRDQFLLDVKSILQSPAGYNFLKWLMIQCKAEQTLWHPSGLMNYNVGEHDIQRKLRILFKAADPNVAAKLFLELVPDEGE